MLASRSAATLLTALTLASPTALIGACSTGPGAACAKLRPLNQAVREGRLSEAQRTCLQARLADPSDDDRRVVSQLLLADARKLDDGGATWSGMAQEHVKAFPGDVVTWVHLANHRQRQGPSGAQESLQFARDGLSWLQRHPAQTPAEKRAHHDLMKARAVAAEMLAPPSSGPQERERTARYARDWFVIATAMDLPTERAMAMCINAGAVPAFCRGETTELYGGDAGAGDTDATGQDTDAD